MGKSRDDYPELIAEVSEIDIARLAAYIDGEGTIYINASTKLRGRMKNYQHSLSLVISNTDPRLMSWLKNTFDGSVYHVKYEKCKHLGTKPIMRWQANERMAASILQRTIPHMIMKKSQAEVGVAFMALKKSRGDAPRNAKGHVKPTCLSESEVAVRHAMKLEIERLNKFGYLEQALIN